MNNYWNTGYVFSPLKNVQATTPIQ